MQVSYCGEYVILDGNNIILFRLNINDAKGKLYVSVGEGFFQRYIVDRSNVSMDAVNKICFYPHIVGCWVLQLYLL
jgi:hypothetical protein